MADSKLSLGRIESSVTIPVDVEKVFKSEQFVSVKSKFSIDINIFVDSLLFTTLLYLRK